MLWAAVLVGIATVVALYLWKWRNQGSDIKRLPKGSLGYPMVGETLQFMAYFSTSDPDPFIYKRVAKYGKIFKSHLFGKPTIISADAELNKFVMQNDKKLFNMGYPTSFAEILGSYDMLMVNGELHKKMRNYAMTFLTSKKLQDYLLSDIDDYVLLALSTWKGRIVNVQDEAKAYTFRVVAKQLISYGPGEESDSLMREYYQLFEGIFSLPLKIPGSGYVKAVEARRRILKRLTKVIDARKLLEEDDHMDLLATVLSEKAEDRMPNEQIMDYFLGLLSAGHVSTATGVLFAVAFLTDCPEALNQLREENLAVRKGLKPGEKISWDLYKTSMPFTIHVVFETLRLTNVSHGLYRTAIEDIQYEGYTIPKGWTVLAYARAVHLDEHIYEDPFTFNPWRWKNMSPTINNFMVFGGGPRQCAGYELAKLEIAMFLHHLVTKFSWKQVEKDKMVYFPTVRMIKGLRIVVEDLKHPAY